MEDSSDRQSQRPDGGTSLKAMARASRAPSPSAPPPPPSRNSGFSSPFVSDDPTPKHEELPPPYEDASGFIDLDKLRAAAMAQAASRPPSFAPSASFDNKGPRTPPPVAASIFAPAGPPAKSAGPSQLMGFIMGGSIAAAGLVAAFFIATRSNSPQETPAARAASPAVTMAPLSATQPVATVAQLPAATTAMPAAAQPTAAQAATELAAQAATEPAAQAAAPPATPAATTVTAAAQPAAPAVGRAAPAAADRAPAVAKADDGDDTKGKSTKATKLAARGAKSESDKAEAPAYEAPKDNPAAGNSFLKALEKSPELVGGATAAPKTAAEPTPPALPTAAGPKTGLAAAIQKAGAQGGAPGAAAAAPAPASPAAAPAAGLPDLPSPGAVQSALVANNRNAKACVKGQEAPSRASVTFGSDGKAQSVTVTGPAAGTPAEECIKAALGKASVGAFAKPSYQVAITIRP